MRRDPLTGESKPAEVYEEELKLYGAKWKMTNLYAEQPST